LRAVVEMASDWHDGHRDGGATVASVDDGSGLFPYANAVMTSPDTRRTE